jgi:SAM-dependent methyltransferase
MPSPTHGTSPDKPQPPDLPYIPGMLEDIASGDEDMGVLWQRHLHWGYWEDPGAADGSVEDYAAASERLAQMHFELAGIRDGMRVLDCGCGVGGAVDSMDERFSDVGLVGLNIDDSQLEVARRRVHASPGNTVDFVHADACDLPFEAESFDAIVALECIMHFPSRRRFLREARRVLRPGGRLVVTDLLPFAPTGPLLLPAALTLRVYGESNMAPPPPSLYRILARWVGMPLEANIDITRHTLPTFDLLGPYLERHVPGGERQTRTLARLLRLGLMRYRLLMFEKRG